ncbi:MAG TPA: hypothetical protein VME23_17640 [Terracidiphilus sp.]|nr:hypothetical protein [Terracidiphilus sp.]
MFEFSRTVVSMSTAGLLVIAAGIVARRHDLKGASLPDRAIPLGRVFVAASLATFGALHLASARGLSSMVPKYMPWPLFWVYLVGFGLIATALSLIFDKAVRWSGLMCGGMFLLFVAMLDLPAITTMFHDRFGAALFVREISFGSGLIALSASMGEPTRGKSRMVAICRTVFGLVAIFYGVETVLHPEFLPGVPLEKVTPAWEPAARLWGYAIGAFLLVCGAFILANRWAKKAGAWLGVAIAVAVIVVYLPMLGPAHGTDQMVEALDYIFDTLLFAGTALILAEGIGRVQPE